MSSATLAHESTHNSSAAKASQSGSSLSLLRVNKPGDAHEQEADRVADQVGRSERVSGWSLSSTGLGQVQRQTPPSPGPPPDPTAKPLTTDDIPKKVGEALLETKEGKAAVNAIKKDPLVKSTTDFLKTPAGIVIGGAAATGMVAGLAKAGKPLPLQIPKLPLDFIHPGLGIQLKYEGPVNRPSAASITLSFTPSAKKKDKKPNYHAEAEEIRASMEMFRPKDRDTPAQDTPAKDPVASPPQSGSAAAPVPDVITGADPAAKPEDKKREETPVQGAVQRKAVSALDSGVDLGGAHAGAAVQDALRGYGRPLDADIRHRMESRIGHDFSKVKVFTDSRAAESARDLNASAYTVGSSIVFDSGKYEPQSTAGKKLLAHELAHVVQQDGKPLTGKGASLHAPQHGGLPSKKSDASSSLRIGPAHDSFEQEADRAAERVVDGGPGSRHGSAHRRVGWSLSRVGLGSLQRQCSCGGTCDDCKKKKEVLRRTAACSAEAGGHAPASVASTLSRPGSALDIGTRRFMESRFGYDFSSVRIHTDSDAAQSAREVNAAAYTVGSSIVFDRGQFQPQSPAGRKLLAHELAHVVQAGSSTGLGERAIVRRAPPPPGPQGQMTPHNIDAELGAPLTEEEMFNQIIRMRAQPLSTSAYRVSPGNYEQEVKSLQDKIDALKAGPAGGKAPAAASRAELRAAEKALSDLTRGRAIGTFQGGGARAGTGKITYAAIQVTSADGRRIAFQIDTTESAAHAEQKIIAWLRKAFQGRLEQLEGASMQVVGDQDVCVMCLKDLQDFAKTMKMRSVKATVFGGVRPSGRQIRPRTVVRTATEPVSEGTTLVPQRTTLYESSAPAQSGAGSGPVGATEPPHVAAPANPGAEPAPKAPAVEGEAPPVSTPKVPVAEATPPASQATAPKAPAAGAETPPVSTPKAPVAEAVPPSSPATAPKAPSAGGEVPPVSAPKAPAVEGAASPVSAPKTPVVEPEPLSVPGAAPKVAVPKAPAAGAVELPKAGGAGAGIGEAAGEISMPKVGVPKAGGGVPVEEVGVAGGGASLAGIALGAVAELAIGIVIGLVLAWLQEKAEKARLERDLRALDPEIEAELRKQAAQIMELQKQNKKIYARLTIDVRREEGITIEEGVAVQLSQYMMVSLVPGSVGVTDQEVPASETKRDEPIPLNPGLSIVHYLQTCSVVLDDPQKRALEEQKRRRDKESAEAMEKLRREAAKHPAPPPPPSAQNAPLLPPLAPQPQQQNADFDPLGAGKFGGSPIREAEATVAKFKRRALRLIARGDEMLSRSPSPSRTEADAYLHKEELWRAAATLIRNDFIQNGPDVGVGGMNEVLESDQYGGRLKQIRQTFGE